MPTSTSIVCDVDICSHEIQPQAFDTSDDQNAASQLLNTCKKWELIASITWRTTMNEVEVWTSIVKQFDVEIPVGSNNQKLSSSGPTYDQTPMDNTWIGDI